MLMVCPVVSSCTQISRFGLSPERIRQLTSILGQMDLRAHCRCLEQQISSTSCVGHQVDSSSSVAPTCCFEMVAVEEERQQKLERRKGVDRIEVVEAPKLWLAELAVRLNSSIEYNKSGSGVLINIGHSAAYCYCCC